MALDLSLSVTRWSSGPREDGPKKFKLFLLCLVPALVLAFGEGCAADEVHGENQRWQEGYATFSGGPEAGGTLGGACGYGNLYDAGYGVNTAAVSTALFNEGLTCGACFEIACVSKDSKWCISDQPSVNVTATNFCLRNHLYPSEATDVCCSDRMPHFDISVPAFRTIAVDDANVVPVLYRRVMCERKGGMLFTINGDQRQFVVLLTNVAGAGDVRSVSVRGNSTGWIALERSWGQNWSMQNLAISGSVLSFQVTDSDGRVVTSDDMVPRNWTLGETFEGGNFKY